MVMGLEEMDGETFLVKVCKGWRFTVPELVREKLGLNEGDRLYVNVRKE